MTVYDTNNKGYDGLVYIELSAPYLQQVNIHGNVKIVVKVKCWVVHKKSGEINKNLFTAKQFKCNKSDDLKQKLMYSQQEIGTNIEHAQIHESGMELDQAIQCEIGVGEYIIWRGILICING